MSGHAYKRSSSLHCNFANTECWYVRVHPKIESISASSGYTDGGQTLTIAGQGLQGDSVSVTVDDVTCDVESVSETAITCRT